YAHRLRIERIDLVEPDDLGLLGQPVALSGEFFTDRAVCARNILKSAIPAMENHATTLDMANKAGTDPGPSARAFEQPGQVGQYKLVVMQPNDTELRL